jgi:hypothetical protein
VTAWHVGEIMEMCETGGSKFASQRIPFDLLLALVYRTHGGSNA